MHSPWVDDSGRPKINILAIYRHAFSNVGVGYKGVNGANVRYTQKTFKKVK